MSYQPLWLRDLVAYSIQAAALVGVGVIMARVLRLRLPQVRHAYWQALLAACVLLPLLQPWRPEILESSGAAFTNVTMTAAPAPAPTGPSIAEIVLGLIFAGIVLRIAWMGLGLGRLWLYRRRAQRIEQTPEAVEDAQRLAPVSPSFFISHQLPTPATFGFFRPAILFPARFMEMEPAMQKAVALHELLHVERRDWLWNMFEEIVLTLLWFHLPLWWVVRSARLSREQVVDAEAVRRSNDRLPYLKALLEMAGQKRLAESLPAPLFLRESQLAERVALIMKEVHMSRKRLAVSILTAASALLIAGASLVWAFPLKTSATQAVETETSSTAVQSEPEASGTSLPANPVAPEAGLVQKSTKVYKVGGNVSAPIPIYKPAPPYSKQARKAKYQGNCVLWIVVNAQGNVTSAKVVKPLGMGLDLNALTTVKTWRFKPAMRDGVAVPVKVMIEISFRGDRNKKSDSVSQKNSRAADPPTQDQQNPSTSRKQDQRNQFINQREVQRQVDEAMKQAKIAQEAASRIDQKKIQEQVEQAMKQAKIAQENFAKIDQTKIQQQVEKAMKQLDKVNTSEMRLKMQQQMKQLQEINTPEMRRQMEEAMRQLLKLNTPEMRLQMQKQMEQLRKMNTPEMREQLRQAVEQAKAAQQAAAKVNKAEIQREVEKASKEVDAARLRAEAEKARKDAAAARKENEKLREQLKKQQVELQMHHKKARPLPSSPVLPGPPAPPSSEKVATPPAPPASPVPPSALPSTGKVSVPSAPPSASPAPPLPPQN